MESKLIMLETTTNLDHKRAEMEAVAGAQLVGM